MMREICWRSGILAALALALTPQGHCAAHPAERERERERGENAAHE
jgi:hypothetical protein